MNSSSSVSQHVVAIILALAVAPVACALNVQTVTATRQVTGPVLGATPLQFSMPPNAQHPTLVVRSTASTQPSASVQLSMLTASETSQRSLQDALDRSLIEFVASAGNTMTLRVAVPTDREDVELSALSLLVPEGAPLDLTTSDGDIDVSNNSDSVRIRVSNGSMTVNTDAVVDLRSDNGTIRGSVGSGSVHLSNGEVQLDWSDTAHPMTVQTDNGAVRIRLPAGAGVSLDLRTTNGSVRVGEQQGRPEHDQAGQSVVQALHGGGALLSVRCSNGEIVVTEGP